MASKATPDDNFKLLLSGIDGLHVGAVQTNNDAHVLPNFTLPVGAAPVLPSAEDNLEQILTSPENLPLYKDQSVHRLWAREPCVESLYYTTLMPVQTDICVERDHRTGQLCGYKEDLLDQSFAANKSMSLHRQPGPPEQTLRGSSSNYPFWPGGLDEPKSDLLKQSGHESSLIDLENELLTIAPGLDSGMSLPKQSIEKFIQESSQQQNVSQISLLDVLSGEHEFDLLTHSPDEDNIKTDDMPPVDIHDQDIDTLIKENMSVKTDALSKKAPTTTDDNKWAIAVDIKTTVHDFHKRIPDMAFKWPFELDVFQKQAILCLEQNQNVFVAAHTSAGKTVVAEYAVALCMRHMTKSIYTSPIKALSNQKFRDFKNTFGDVGLVTGDVQLQPEASCLIMTTEILRSMLYNGSDTIRDLECVIFDEVHYINDADRGVVWEEVLIMLPDHVKIVLLSATVPNTMEFANWIGRIKRKHVYVVSTPKRPVPLEHFLYTGNSNKTSNELFCILDAQNKFSEINYKKAVAAKKERASKSAMTTGPKGHRSGAGGIQQDKAIWLSLIEMLRKKDKLPVVAFVFSKKNIDQTSSRLQNVDLTSTTEKAEIHTFFQKCVTRLKGSDRQLPQVKLMSDSLKRGLGIHHSGILPILREVVEMLFAKGLVKVLFATETFAMGVNMPARTVVFDNTRKHDGINFRDLLPGEYIQMAGRSGRRGIDATGTVILLCKGDVTPIIDLHRMMLGKPTQLESQFRLTYTMMLNLLRVEQLRVEDMMKRSFSEFHNQQKAGEQQETLKNLLREAELLPEVQDYSGDLQRYYDTCDEYWTLKQELQFVIMTHPQATQALSPGRVLVIDTPQHTNALALLLQVTHLKGSDSKTFTVLVMCEQNTCDKETTEGNNEYPRPVLAAKFFYPNGPCGHRVLEIDGQYITEITRKIIKQPVEKILQNWKQRQIPRFSDTPPNQPTMTAVQELCRIVESNPNNIQALDPVKDFKLRDLDLVDKFTKLNQFKERFLGFMCVHDPLFEENFMQLRKHMKIQKKCGQLKYLLSDESLMLLPEYQQRIDVLKGLNYIDETHTVQLKGRVACEMSSHELILTELLFDNALTALHPTEIAALLSCVVFDMKKVDEPKLHSDLEKAREHFIQVATMIGELQKAQKLPIEVQDYVGQFKFGLMEVVFEWARGMPFCDITALTSVQEGVIVRCIQRLDEVLRDVYKAARIVGDQVLCTKMQEAITAIKRDIVFTASLYTQ